MQFNRDCRPSHGKLWGGGSQGYFEFKFKPGKGQAVQVCNPGRMHGLDGWL